MPKINATDIKDLLSLLGYGGAVGAASGAATGAIAGKGKMLCRLARGAGYGGAAGAISAPAGGAAGLLAASLKHIRKPMAATPGKRFVQALDEFADALQYGSTGAMGAPFVAGPIAGGLGAAKKLPW